MMSLGSGFREVGSVAVGKMLDDPRLKELCASSLGYVPEGDQSLIWLDRGGSLLPEQEPERLRPHILFEKPSGVPTNVGAVLLAEFKRRYLLVRIPQPNNVLCVGQPVNPVVTAKFLELHPGHVLRFAL